MIEFKMPSLGADMESGTMREWKVKVGDSVKRGDIIAEIETQKGLIEIEVFEEGIVEKLLVQPDEKVPVGAVMAHIRTTAEGVKTTIVSSPEVVLDSPKKESITKKITIPESHASIHASPLAKKIAEDNHIDLSLITGSGENGVITKQDVERAIAGKAKQGVNEKSSTLDSIRMAIAAAMSKSNREIPHYYLETKIDMSKALAWLAEQNKNLPIEKRLLLVVLLIKAVSRALIEVPELNAYWENGIQVKSEINIGFVVSLRGGGLMIPTILNTEKKSINGIMETLTDVIPRARALKLRSSELGNATITITNIGDNGVEKVFGVIYPPQVAIVGFGSISEQPVAESGMLDVRPVLTVTLAGDHRATDGHIGSKFLQSVKTYLQNPNSL